MKYTHIIIILPGFTMDSNGFLTVSLKNIENKMNTTIFKKIIVFTMVVQ